MLSVKILILYCLLQTISSQSGSYDTLCTCTQTSTNGLFCQAWQCRTDQITKCFSSDATVEIMKTKQRKPMKYLDIGEQILVDIDHRNQPIYEPVYAFIHASENGTYDYLKITVDNHVEQPLIISSNHLVFRFNQSKPMFAGYLKVGDQLESISKDNIKQAGTIIDIALIKSQGFYAPLTRSGKLVVDGIVVSNYAVVANHQLAHLAIQPYRWWIDFAQSTSYSEHIHWYCQVLYSLIEQINQWLFSIELYDGSFFISKF